MATLAAPLGTRPRFYTAEELEQMPDDERYELIRGELIPMPDNSADHGDKTLRISIPAGAYVYAHGLGRCFAAETRFILARRPDTVLAPDFAFVAKERIPKPWPKQGYLELAPDLVLETVSPSETKREVSLKAERWTIAGTRLVWVLEPIARTLTVRRPGVDLLVLGPDDTLAGEDVLPGFELSLRGVFEDAEPG